MTSPARPLPALLGGPAVRPEGPPDWPVPDEDVLAALQRGYRDGSWGKYHGGNVERLEQALAEYHQVEFVQTCGSGTFAVEAALLALRIGMEDEVLLAAYDYPGNFLSVHAVGALPVLVDLCPTSWQLDVERVAAAIGPKTRAVLASHLHGGVVPMRELMELAARHSLRVIEDAAQAPGALVQGRRAGTWGDVGILSFGGSKLLTAGRGGALLTRHADVYQRAKLFLHRGN
jgi:dTDP-4-amino-4,6-dideoxygalactose transaminase